MYMLMRAPIKVPMIGLPLDASTLHTILKNLQYMMLLKKKRPRIVYVWASPYFNFT